MLFDDFLFYTYAFLLPLTCEAGIAKGLSQWMAAISTLSSD